MADLIRKKDWSKTQLGPIESWPASLRTMLGVVLNSRFPMLIWWGPELLHLYNDAYRPILREKHPASLGAPAAEMWAEVWDVAGPMVDGVMGGGPATWTEDLQLFIRNGEISEETFFTFSYSPILGEDSKVAGILNTVQETTAKVQGERRIKLLHDLAARASEAKSEGEAYRVIMNVLAGYEIVTPFVLLYKYDDKKEVFHLSGSTGFGSYDGPAKKVESWPLKEVLETNSPIVVDKLNERFPSLPKGHWGASPRSAVVLPMSRKESGLEAVLVVAVSPHRHINEQYRRFIDALADQVVTLIVNARAFEIEKRRVQELASLDETKTVFFGNISHEFRTPLTLMLGPMQESLLRTDLPQDHIGQLELMYRNALRLQRLVNSLLEFSRIEAGKFKAMFEPVEIGKYTSELASAFESAMQEAGLEFINESKPLSKDVYIDYDKWETIVLNLLSNALKFTFAGHIKIATEEKADYAELTVEDTGIGIPKAELPHLFERFHRIHGAKSRTAEGSGIGLAVVNELVKMHGGTIKVASKEGKGTTFIIRIPYGSAHLPKDQVMKKLQIARAPSVTMHAYTEEALGWVKKDAPRSTDEPDKTKSRPDEVILVVDDNADMRHYIHRVLNANTSLHIETVSNGREALAYMEKKVPSLIVSDIMMPEMNGIELVNAVRKNPKIAKIPFIFLSARAGEREKAEGIVEGVDAYLTKPFSAFELVATVRTQLDLAALRKN